MKKEYVSNGEVYELLQGYKDNEGTIHKEFELREMDGSDEEAISKKEVKSNGAKVLRTLLERCCIRIGTLYKAEMKPSKWVEIIQSLATGDQDYMLLQLRKISVGEEIETKYQCTDSECKEDINLTIEVDELEIIPFDGLWEFEFELPRGYKDKDGNYHKVGKMRHPNGLDREALDSIMRNNTGLANTLMLSRCVVELEGTPVHDEVIRSLPIKDRTYLIATLKEHYFGANMEVEVECPTCYNTFKASLNAVNFI